MKTIITITLFVFAFAYSNAQIVYTDINPDSTINISYNLDLNNDGTTDFVINDSTWTVNLPNCGNTTDHGIIITPLNGNAILCDSNHNPFSFQANEMIEPSSFSLSWSAIPHQNLQRKSFICMPSTPRGCGCTLYRLDSFYNGEWLNGLEAYMGLKLIKNGNTYFGWVRLSFSRDHVAIKDYAYNSTPGESILARQGGNILPEAIPSIQWQKSLAGPDGGDNSQNGRSLIQSVQQTADGGYIVSGAIEIGSIDGKATGWHYGVDNYGYLTRDYWIVKLDNTGNVVWQKALGGTGDDYATSIKQTSDGGYIIAGNTTSSDGDVSGLHQGVDENGNPTGDYWIVKLNSTGDIVWQKTLGGTNNDNANSIEQTTDGGYIVAGSSSSNDGDVSGNHSYPGNDDYWVAKLNSSGNIEWQECLGSTNGDEARSIEQTKDGGFVVAGYSGASEIYSQYWVVKLTNTGSVSWDKYFGGLFNSGAESIRQTTDGGYIVAGHAISTIGDFPGNFGGSDYLVLKLDNVGNVIWQKSLGGTGAEIAESIQQTVDGGYIVTGPAGSNNLEVAANHGNYDYWTVKLDTDGNISWRKSLGGAGDDEAKSIQQTTDGGYIIAGFSNSNDGDVTGNHSGYDMWIVKLGADIIVPVRLLSFTGALQNNTTKLHWQTSNEINTADYMVERSSNATNFSAIGKVNAQQASAITCSYNYIDDKPLQGVNYYRLKMEDKNGKFTYSNIIRINYDNPYSLNVSPVPAYDIVTITGAENFTTVQFMNVSGRIVKQFGKMLNNIFPIAGLSKGIYYIKLSSKNDSRLLKMIKE